MTSAVLNSEKRWRRRMRATRPTIDFVDLQIVERAALTRR
jgi:hypothetical protein